MQKCEITLSQLGFISDIDNSDNLRKIVKRLPMHLRVKWVDIAHSITESGREPRFTDLTKFIDQKSRIAASMYGLDLTKERADIKGSSGMRNKPHDYVRERVSTYATNNLHTSENVKHEQKCICCNGTCRYIEFCSKFKSMNLADRLKWLNQSLIIQLRTLLVTVRQLIVLLSKNCVGLFLHCKGEDGNSCQTYALLDDGADKT
ncbi:unnamed protein product [Mytilus edulis]|uniref:Uncharacterized protein n=1 Tax=Mytilus edulis TaxID=6550 RepID=A0A8S3SCE8_MYTED|nr:unnamed protein product [Mytilus edulis]